MENLNNLYTELNCTQDEAIFKDVIAITEPESILEIGTFHGGSSLQWLTHSNANVVAIDPIFHSDDEIYARDHNLPFPPDKSDQFAHIEQIKAFYPTRYTFIQKDSQLVRPDLEGKNFDLIYVDGDHSELGVRNDITLALEKQIDWVLLDDYNLFVEQVFVNEFKDKFLYPIRVYPKKDMFQGKPIIQLLLKRRK